MALTSEEVNYLVYRYLQESGFTHTAFTFSYESLITKSPVLQHEIPPGALITFLQKGLAYTDIEEHLNEDGTERQCDEVLSLVTAHVCHSNSSVVPATSTPEGKAGATISAGDRSTAAAIAAADPDATTAASTTNPTPTPASPTKAAANGPIEASSTPPTTSAANGLITTPAAQASSGAGGEGSGKSGGDGGKTGGGGGDASRSKIKLKGEPKGQQKEEGRGSGGAKSTSASTPVDADDASATSSSSDRATSNGTKRDSGGDAAAATNAADPPDNGLQGMDVDGGVDEPANKRAKGAGADSLEGKGEKGVAAKTPKTESGDKHGQTRTREPTDVPPDAVAILTSHTSEVFMCAWNPKHDLLASGSGDATARIWKIDPDSRGKAVTTSANKSCITLKHSTGIGDKNKDVTTLEWNWDGSLLATGSYDGVARVWERTGELQHTLQAHEGPIFSLKWNAAGNYLLSGSSDWSTIVWDAASGTIQQRFQFHTAATLDVDWKDNKTFASCSTDRSIMVLEVGQPMPQQTFEGHTDEVNAIKWDPTGRLLASCSDDYTAKIWEPKSKKWLHDLREHSKEIYTIKWSPRPERQQLLASASFDATVKLWDVEVGKVLSSLSRNGDPVYSVAFSPSGEYLATGSFAGHLYVWNVKDGSLTKSYHGNGDIFEVAWNHREDRIAACFSTSAVSIIDLKV